MQKSYNAHAPDMHILDWHGATLCWGVGIIIFMQIYSTTLNAGAGLVWGILIIIVSGFLLAKAIFPTATFA